MSEPMLNTMDHIPPKQSNNWPEHLDRCAELVREISKMTALPNNVKKLNYVANDLELLASQMRHPSNG